MGCEQQRLGMAAPSNEPGIVDNTKNKIINIMYGWMYVRREKRTIKKVPFVSCKQI